MRWADTPCASQNAVQPATVRVDEPTLIQNIDTRGMRPRTFALDPAGRVLVAANQEPFFVREGELVRTVPASLAVFRVGADGKLDFVRKYDVAASERRNVLWMGIVRVRLLVNGADAFAGAVTSSSWAFAFADAVGAP